MVQLAQSFVNSRPFVTNNIIGATTMDQLKENIGSIEVELSQDTLDKINLIHKIILILLHDTRIELDFFSIKKK